MADPLFSPEVMTGVFSGVGIMKWVLAGIIIIACGVGVWFLFKNKTNFRYKPEVWGLAGGLPDVLQADKAKPIRIRTKEGINSLLYFKKLKRYLKMPSRIFFVGKKIRFWYRPDAELTPIQPVKVHFFDRIKIGGVQKKHEEMLKQAEQNQDVFVPLVMEDVNERFAVMQVKFINEDARLSHVSTGKIIRDMFSINKFFKEHGATILMILGVIALAFAFILMADGMKDYNESGATVAEASGKIADRIDKSNEGMTILVDRIDSLIKELKPYQTTNPPND